MTAYQRLMSEKETIKKSLAADFEIALRELGEGVRELSWFVSSKSKGG